MRFLGNLLWFVFAGLWLAIGYLVSGILNCITIIGIPFGIQSFKLAGYVLWPFGKVVVRSPDRMPVLGFVGNIIWLIFGGLWMAVADALLGVLFCITIIGIPFGIILFRMAGLSLAPFGKSIVDERLVAAGAEVVIGPARPRLQSAG